MRSAPVFVSHHQFQVIAGGETGDYLDLYTVGDDLLQVTGRAQVTVLTGPHTRPVEVSAEVAAVEPADDVDGWDATAEATLWCAGGQLVVCGLMGDCPDALADLTVGRPGLVRVRVSARNRRPDEQPPDPQAPEQYRVLVWPVDEDAGFRSLRGDDLPPARWTPDPARAAGWAMVRLVALANPNPQEAALRQAAVRAGAAAPEPPVGRVQVRRRRSMPAPWTRAFLQRPADHLGAVADGAGLVLPAGEVEVRIEPTGPGDRFAGRWRWATRPGSAAAVPDEADSHVEIQARPGAAGEPGDLTVVHSGLRAPDAVLLGLVWEHLLEHISRVAAGDDVPAHPWVPIFAELAAQAAADAAAHSRSMAAFEARLWGGGAPPTERLRGLPANAIGLGQLDRRLLDRLADATPPTQRAVARWAARQACAIAGLDTLDWIAAALAALDRGEPLPAPFGVPGQAFERMWADERAPRTTVTIPTGTPNCSQQAIALPAIAAAAHDDPLAAAVDTVYFAAIAAGDQYRAVLAAADTELAANPAQP